MEQDSSTAQEPKGLLAAIQQLLTESHCEAAFYAGALYRDNVYDFLELIDSEPAQSKHLFFILTTPGGDADAAYILAQGLRSRYDEFTLGVFGYCKSAGTLVALGARSLVMSPDGELGPIDVQLIKDDELIRRNSGLDILWALQVLSREHFRVFEEAFLSIISRSQGFISTLRAMEIATQLATGLIGPIAEQMEPIKLGEIQRSLDITGEYAKRLGASDHTLNQLLNGYPCHSFVIDFGEACKIGFPVRPPSQCELEFYRAIVDQFGKGIFRNPDTQRPLILIGRQISNTQRRTGDVTEDKGCASGEHSIPTTQELVPHDPRTEDTATREAASSQSEA
jgi:hypothetical protein